MPEPFRHRALSLGADRTVVFTAMSKRLFFARMFISKHVFDQGAVPVNPFMVFDYFLLDTVGRDAVREANNNLLRRCDELWVYGPVSDGVLSEILLARSHGLPVRYFAVDDDQRITPIEPAEVTLEPDVAAHRDKL